VARPRGEVPPHGTRQRYQHRSEPCRCGGCQDANARYVAGRRAVREVLSQPAWREQRLPDEYLPKPVMVGCTHSLQTVGERCSWCGKIADTVAPIPGLVAA
jgi:hypothetical protein